MSVINFDERYKSALIKGFEKASDTDSLFDHSLDMEFSGVKTVHVKSIITEPLQDYDRHLPVSVTVGDGMTVNTSRYGATKEVGNEEQTFTMTQDKSLSLSVDKGNNKEVMDKHKVGEIMAAERDEHIIPYVDTYRLKKWAETAGMYYELATEPDSETIVADIIKARNLQRNKGVKGDVTLLIPYEHLDALMLAKQWINLDSLGGKTLPTGTVGQISGMNVKPVSNDRWPQNVAFMIIHKQSVISPMKIKDFKGHVDPPGLSGDLIEFRMIFDAFVLGKKCDGVLVAVLPGYKMPELDLVGNEIQAKGRVAAAPYEIYYTTDGSDPRYSTTAKQGDRVQAELYGGEIIKAYAKALNEGEYNSNLMVAKFEPMNE